jgi:hypothetical protein
LLEHDRFEELASLSAIGELSPSEHEELLRHQNTCAQCREVEADTRSLAGAAFLAGSPNDGIGVIDVQLHQRLREGISRNLTSSAPISFVQRYKHRFAAGVAAAFILGTGVGTAAGYRAARASILKLTKTVASSTLNSTPGPVAIDPNERSRLQAVAVELQTRFDQMTAENLVLREKLTVSGQYSGELESRLAEVEKQSTAQDDRVVQAHNELSVARSELSQAKESVSASQTKIDTLQYILADKEARLVELSANVERAREMLSQGREVRDIMGARDLHIVDVVDRDGKGRARKAFGRAFYTQGKSLIFYAFDLPVKSTADGKFVYAAWGTNSNNVNSKSAHSLGIFYNDDQTQHRWAMKFDDPKLLEEIDTVFVTLEPTDRSFTMPTGKPILEAYFGTPPNHP